MNRQKKVIRNIIIIIVLFTVWLLRSGLYFTPISAHEMSEKGLHYGPSEIKGIIDFEKGKYLLCKYDKWISCDTVLKTGPFWRFGSQSLGTENDKSKDIFYTWRYSDDFNIVYGVINNSKIKSVQITLNTGEILLTEDIYDDMFLIHWKSQNNDERVKYIVGFDDGNNIIFNEYEK